MPLSAAQKRAYAIKMANMKRARNMGYNAQNKIAGYGAYRRVVRRNSRSVLRKSATPKLDYPGVGSALGSAAGMLFGGPTGAAIGSSLGGGLQNIIKKITGFGDYKVNENSILKGGLSPPEVMNVSKEGGFVVRHREYVADINSSVAFTLQSFDLNPGLVTTFPWLSTVAQGFEQYRFRGVVAEFKSLSSDAVVSTNANASLGSIVFATAYNSLNANFVDKKSMENYEFANSTKPSCDMLHPIECAKSQTPLDHLYVRVGSLPSGADQRMYDLGNLQIATVGNQSSTGVLGEFWISYEVELYKPKLLAQQGLQLLTDHFQLSGTINASNPFGSTTSVAKSGSLLGCTITNGTTINFPANLSGGTFLYTWVVFGASTPNLNTPLVTLTNCTSVALFKSDSLSSYGTETSTTASIMYFNALVKITGQNATIAFGTAGTLPGSISAGDLTITQINGGITA